MSLSTLTHGSRRSVGPMISIAVHADRFNADGRKDVKIAGVVVHTTEGSEDDGGVRAYLQMKGDRPTSSGGAYGSSYDAQAVSDGAWIEFELGADGLGSPYSAPPLNKRFLHIVIPGKAAQFDDETGWRDNFSEGCIRAVAAFIAAKALEHGFPTVRLTAAELAAAGIDACTGYCGHGDVSRAWPDGGSQGHTDPGPNFPWDLLAEEIAKLQHPEPKEDFMWSIIIPTKDGEDCYARFVAPVDARGIAGIAIWSGPSEEGQAFVDAHKALGAKEVRVPIEGLRNVVLLGRLPFGDVHNWTLTDFHESVRTFP